jgi:hypothetical protein
MLLQLLALTTLAGAYTLLAAHFLWLLFAALALSVTYRLGARWWNPRVGAIAAVWLAANPLFFAQAEILVLEVPLTALTLLAALWLIERRAGGYLAAGSILMLSKEAAQLALPGFVLFAWADAPAGRRLRAAAIASAPVLVLLAWLIACKIRYGWFVHPFMLGSLPGTYATPAGLVAGAAAQFARLCFQLVCWDGNWAIAALVLLALIQHRPRASFRELLVAGTLGAVVYWALPRSANTLVAALQASPPVTGGLLHDTLAQLEAARAVLAVLTGLAVLAARALRRIEYRDPRLWLIAGVIAGYTLFFATSRFRMVRYLLPVYPFVLLLGAAAADRLAAARRAPVLAIAAVIVLIFVARFDGARSGPGNILETNLEFRDMIAVRQAAARYLEGLGPTRILATWPETLELRFPFAGYVARPLHVVELPDTAADVLYVSPQSSDPDLAATLRRLHPAVRLQLLQEFHERGKSVRLYRIDRAVNSSDAGQ